MKESPKQSVYKYLLPQGFPWNVWIRFMPPIGLDIGAKTLEDIAVRIVAERIQVREAGQRAVEMIIVSQQKDFL